MSILIGKASIEPRDYRVVFYIQKIHLIKSGGLVFLFFVFILFAYHRVNLLESCGDIIDKLVYRSVA